MRREGGAQPARGRREGGVRAGGMGALRRRGSGVRAA